MTVPATRFVGGETLNAMLTGANMTLADWNALAAKGEVPPATYAYPRAARWRRADVAAFLSRHAAQTQTQNRESETTDV